MDNPLAWECLLEGVEKRSFRDPTSAHALQAEPLPELVFRLSENAFQMGVNGEANNGKQALPR
jgi:hypothetical protein